MINKRASNINSIVGGFVSSLMTIRMVSRTYSESLEIILESPKIIITGILEGLSESSPDIVFKADEIEDVLKSSIDNFIKEDYHFVNDMRNNFNEKYNKQYKKLSKFIDQQNIEEGILATGDKLVKGDNLDTMLATIERLTNKSSFEGSYHKQIIKAGLVLRAGSNVIKGEIHSGLFMLGKTIGSSISRAGGGISDTSLLKVIKDAFVVYDYVSNLVHKTMKLPSQLLDMGLAVCIAFSAGVVDAAIEREEVKKEYKLDTTNTTYIEQLKEASQGFKKTLKSISDDFATSYDLQRKKLDKLDQKISRDDGIERVLAEKPTAKLHELEALKALNNHSSKISIAKPIAYGIGEGTKMLKAGTKASKATILATSFKMGKMIGKKCIANQNNNLIKTNIELNSFSKPVIKNNNPFIGR